MTKDLAALAETLSTLKDASAADAQRIVNDVYKDGVVDRSEAEALFQLNASLGGTDPHWDSRFREAIKDFVLTVESPLGRVTQDEADWLVAQAIPNGRATTGPEIDVLLDVLRYADGAAHSLAAATLKAISSRIKAAERASRDDVERMRRALYAPAGDGATWVTRAEATVLFKTNDAVGFARNDPSWNDLFARAIGNHLMAMAHPDPMSETEAFAREKWLTEKSSGVGGMLSGMAGAFFVGGWFEKVTYDEGKAEAARIAARDAAQRDAAAVDGEETGWLMRRLGWDEKVSPAERALIDFLKTEAPGLADGLSAVA